MFFEQIVLSKHTCDRWGQTLRNDKISQDSNKTSDNLQFRFKII